MPSFQSFVVPSKISPRVGGGGAPASASFLLLENGTDEFLLEDGSGVIQLEA